MANRFHRRAGAGLLAVCLGLAAWFGARPVQAWPTNSPSARMAASLAEYPPNNWLAHYLPDDRYKIAGHAWNFVSTQVDTYYHRPNCPRMLRQSADIAIGFYSTRDAEEAGYRPDPYCDPNGMNFAAASLGGGGSAGAGSRGGGRRVLLADRVSSVVLPAGWRRTMSSHQNMAQYGFTMAMDGFQPVGGRSGVMINTIVASNPVAMNMGGQLTADKMRENMQRMKDLFASLDRNSSSGSQAFSQIFDKMQFRDVSVGGLRGVEMTFSGDGSLPGVPGGIPYRSVIFGKGNKFIQVMDMVKNQDATALIASLRIR